MGATSMGIFNLYSKRQKRLRGEVPDVYAYDTIPEPLRVQIVHILRDTLGNENQYNANFYGYTYPNVRSAYNSINDTLCREYGIFYLVEQPSANVASDVLNFFLGEKDVEKVLDVIELSFVYVNRFVRDYSYRGISNASKEADAAIEELNARFKEHGIGYEFKNERIIRVDSEFIHSEAVKPALALLSNKIYKVANDEFFKAHEHYRHARYKDCLAWALKSLESTMKAICKKRKWKYDEGDPAKRLIEICFANGLIPDFWQSHFTALRATLEHSIPTSRNKLAGHGDGTEPIIVPQHLAAYVLHMTASTLVFLIEAEKKFRIKSTFRCAIPPINPPSTAKSAKQTAAKFCEF